MIHGTINIKFIEALSNFLREGEQVYFWCGGTEASCYPAGTTHCIQGVYNHNGDLLFPMSQTIYVTQISRKLMVCRKTSSHEVV